MAEWIRRRGTPRRFRYETATGRAVRDRRTLDRIQTIRVPPAWTDVHIAASPAAVVQAWGFDAKGRRQYRYHARAVERGSLRKYYRVRQLALDLPRIRAQLAADQRRTSPDRVQVSAVVVGLISAGFFRVGGERYARENRTFGITTLLKRHVTIEHDCIRFRYRGKSGVEQRQTVVDSRLAKLVAKQLLTPGTRLFRFRDDDGRWRDLAASDVNEYLHETLATPYTAKDFRTWGGTLRAATLLAELGPAQSPTEAKRNVALAMRLVSSELGNTPAICRGSYVHPMVVARYVDAGETIDPRLQRRGRRPPHAHAAEERALIRFLARHFPERRKRRRKE